ncbi:MAG: large-conductance mechanosensitive channel protein MscL [Clostridia bacterium]|nr:large-conductance mechanosensitive channel protein MscL [Clostridia bacterium]
MLQEFKEFAVKGNALDLAVGVIIGGAFGKIVTSLVNDLIMPILSILIGGINFSDLKYVITPAEGDIAEVAFSYGAFIQSVIDFLIVAFSIFLFIKFLNSLKKKEEEPEPEPESPPEPTKEELLLTEIRDLLKNK